MSHRVIEVDELPDEPLAAAGAFHSDWAGTVRQALGESPCVTLILSPADESHRDWRVAIVRDLARIAAPGRVNMVSRGSEESLRTALDYLASAPGITGQYLPLAEDEA